MQANLQASVGMSTLHTIIASIIKRHSHSRSNEELTSAMEDNRGDIGHVKKGRG